MTGRGGAPGAIPHAARRVASGCRLRLAAALSMALLAACAQAAPIGRLFFTPERRAALERQRQLNIQEKTQETVEIASLHLNGVVRRSGNKTTVWVNGRPQQVDNATAGISVAPSSRDVERVNIRVGEESSTSLRVGETLNRATQEMSDGLAGGQVQVNASPATPRQR